LSSATPIRLLIADGHPIVLEGLRSVLGHLPTLQVVGEASDGMEAIEKTVNLDPDVVLMELKLPRVDGLTVLRSIQARATRSKVILFSSSENKEEFVEAMKLGCSGILSKDSSIGLIEKSIQKVFAERAQLSQREREIIILIAQGYKNKEIAEKMFITEQTVKNHLHNVFDKLGVSDRLELALYAIHNSLHLRS
jgi:two-component system nitrate/nitrite response regulator NarL